MNISNVSQRSFSPYIPYRSASNPMLFENTVSFGTSSDRITRTPVLLDTALWKQTIAPFQPIKPQGVVTRIWHTTPERQASMYRQPHPNGPDYHVIINGPKNEKLLRARLSETGAIEYALNDQGPMKREDARPVIEQFLRDYHTAHVQQQALPRWQKVANFFNPFHHPAAEAEQERFHYYPSC